MRSNLSYLKHAKNGPGPSIVTLSRHRHSPHIKRLPHSTFDQADIRNHAIRLPIKRALPNAPPPKPIKTKARSATILPNFVGLRFRIHNGKVWNEVLITEAMVGHKLGEFSP